MIDERHEELAALYALDLLDGAERVQFETVLARDPALQALVRELRESSSALAHAAPVVAPPAALGARILASVGKTSSAAPAATANVLRPPASIFRTALPWAVAACLALTTGWLGQRFFTSEHQNEVLRDQQALADVALKTAQTLLESERIVSQRQLATIDDTKRRLDDAVLRGTAVDEQRQAVERQLADARAQLADRERQLADARTQVTDRDRQVATLTQRTEALAVAAEELGRQFNAANDQVAKLTQELRSQAELADLKITTLASMLKNSPQALAVAVWDPKKQEGILKFAKLPALAANQDYQLWVVDPQYPDPVDGGVFTVDPKSGRTGDGSVSIKVKQPVQAIKAFAVTRERKGGVPKAEGPFVLLGQ